MNPSTDNPVGHTKTDNQWISGLCSFVAHLLLLLILSIWTIGSMGGRGGIQIDAGDLGSNVGDDLQTFEIQGEVIESETETAPIEQMTRNISITSSISIDQIATESNVGPGIQAHEPASFSESVKASTANLSKNSGFAQVSLSGRSASNRGTVGAKNGATKESELAVAAALDYLARHQSNDGSWSSRFELEPCGGQCTHGGEFRDPYKIASTGLALLCFLGAGHTQHEGQYSEHVSKGIYYLVNKLRRSDNGGYWLGTEANFQMYEHGIATLALCEALQMTDDKSLREPCQAAINFIAFAQHSDGGWDYHPRGPGDLSIAGWQAMALKSAVSAKISIPTNTIRGIDIFLKRTAFNDFQFHYRGGKPTPSMTAIGTLLKMYRGYSKTDPAILKAIQFLSKEGPSGNDVYYNYYATQVLFNAGDRAWKDWNDMMREYLIQNQERQGHMAGSWWFDRDLSNSVGGRIYVTCMACLTLEVYYRYLPVYGESEEEFRL